MFEHVIRASEQLLGRVSGPYSFRLVLQPLVAASLAIRAGVRDARSGRAPFLWALLANSRERHSLLHTAWRDLARILVVAVAIDILYQIEVLRFFYPLQAIAMAVLLAIVPYVVLRGLVTRVATRYRARRLRPAPDPASVISGASDNTHSSRRRHNTSNRA